MVVEAEVVIRLVTERLLVERYTVDIELAVRFVVEIIAVFIVLVPVMFTKVTVLNVVVELIEVS